jgi:hypothetical protein
MGPAGGTGSLSRLGVVGMTRLFDSLVRGCGNPSGSCPTNDQRERLLRGDPLFSGLETRAGMSVEAAIIGVIGGDPLFPPRCCGGWPCGRASRPASPLSLGRRSPNADVIPRRLISIGQPLHPCSICVPSVANFLTEDRSSGADDCEITVSAHIDEGSANPWAEPSWSDSIWAGGETFTAKRQSEPDLVDVNLKQTRKDHNHA